MGGWGSVPGPGGREKGWGRSGGGLSGPKGWKKGSGMQGNGSRDLGAKRRGTSFISPYVICSDY